MSSRILVDPTKAVAAETLQFITAVNDVLAKGRRLKAIYDSMAFGNPADYVEVATELGLPLPGAGTPPSTAAQDAWTIIETAMTQIDSPQVAALSKLDQGG